MARLIIAPVAVLFGLGILSGAWAQNQGPAAFTPEQAAQAAEKMTDIHDIRGMVDFHAFPLVLWWILGAALVLICVLAWWIVRKRKKSPERAGAPPISPEDAALAALAVLHGRIKDGVKPFYYELSAILRTYLGGRYGFGALEMTTPELLPRLADLSVGREIKNELARLSDAADTVKYARGWADYSSMERDLAFVRDFVLMTRHPEETAPDSEEKNQLEPTAV